jgi:hypothetical protein
METISECIGPVMEACLAAEKVMVEFDFEDVSFEQLTSATWSDLVVWCKAKSREPLV